MTDLVTLEQLAAIMPQAHKAGRTKVYLPYLNKAAGSHGITTPQRLAMWLATMAEETGELDAHRETTYRNTPTERILKTFQGVRGLTAAKVEELKKAGDQAFFNYVYADANRPPNYRLGNVRPNDGYFYRGWGPMQITGRGNTERYLKARGLPLDTDPDRLLGPEYGPDSSAQWWQANGCNEIADTGDFTALTIRVNGSTTNLALRQHYYQTALSALTPKPITSSKTQTAIVVGGATTTAAGQLAGDVAPTIADAAKDVLPQAMQAAASPGVVKWVLIGIAVLPLVYAAWRYWKKSKRGEVSHT